MEHSLKEVLETLERIRLKSVKTLNNAKENKESDESIKELDEEYQLIINLIYEYDVQYEGGKRKVFFED